MTSKHFPLFWTKAETFISQDFKTLYTLCGPFLWINAIYGQSVLVATTLRPVLKYFIQKLLHRCNTDGTNLLSKNFVFWFYTFLQDRLESETKLGYSFKL